MWVTPFSGGWTENLHLISSRGDCEGAASIRIKVAPCPQRHADAHASFWDEAEESFVVTGHIEVLTAFR